ncbi:septal ring lytic transglycosylase RlpA family protein [Spirulina sp. CCNP1310]|uniref:septal ring lytic transglycosylase RlpA family protein n=1 Tax=Spirulina sp. CCNP1310 TaxID=3110249 RepID=UPI002B200EB3|nr:septal ring lytic transglycosylase RlpA family protein [Spirulina sp. CCNP1310]MEA5418709.1 septal ring lytic transglycosylase RlpA family protein [Spirulina sp. CCNP1310]
MNKQLMSSVTATVLTTLLGTAGIASAQTLESANSVETANADALETLAASDLQETVSNDAVETASSPRQPQVAIAPSLTTLFPHTVGTSNAATLYVRNIPVLTFIAESSTNAASLDTGFITPEQVLSGEIATTPDHPLARAAAVAQKINALPPETAAELTLKWNHEARAYWVMRGEEAIAPIDAQHILPDSTRNWDQDALQVTNRLRRLVGGAGPLAMANIIGRPQSQFRNTPAPAQSVGQFLQQGIASWYGPGFHGRRSASGERFNQNAMTAAHRTLPFGTQVRVTNLRTGASVVVRINDRGPFTRGRVIDLSRAAAGAIGMIGSGVAPVKVEVLQ